MLRLNILICDDEQQKYDELVNILGSEVYKFEHARSLIELEVLLQTAVAYDVVFLDLYYHRTNDDDADIISEEQIREIRNKIGPYPKLIIYTQFTHRQVELLRSLALDGVINDWVDYNDLLGKEDTLVRLQIMLGSLDRSPDSKDGLWLLHLSDLHYGRQFQFYNEEVGRSLAGLIHDQIQDSQTAESIVKIGLPKMLVLSGDVSNSAKFEELAEAKRFINILNDNLKKLGVVKPVITIAPGNHDVSWHLSMIQEHDIEFDGKEKRVVDRQFETEFHKRLKWMPFEQEMAEYLQQATNSSRKSKWWYYDLSGRHKIRVFCINTSCDDTYKTRKSVITPSLVDEIAEHVEGRSDSLGILITHYPVDSWSEGGNDKEILRLLYNRLSIRVVFSGHKHSSELLPHRIESKKTIIEVQTGSAAASPDASGKWELPKYRIVRIVKNRAGLYEKLQSWTYAYKKGAYIIDPVESTGSPFEEIELT